MQSSVREINYEQGRNKFPFQLRRNRRHQHANIRQAKGNSTWMFGDSLGTGLGGGGARHGCQTDVVMVLPGTGRVA